MRTHTVFFDTPELPRPFGRLKRGRKPTLIVKGKVEILGKQIIGLKPFTVSLKKQADTVSCRNMLFNLHFDEPPAFYGELKKGQEASFEIKAEILSVHEGKYGSTIYYLPQELKKAG